MASYTISAPNGKSYTIEGPSGASQEDVQNEVMRQYPMAAQTGPQGAPAPSPAITPPAVPGTNPGERGEPVAPSRSLGESALRLGGISAKGLVAGALAAPGELAVLGAKGIDWAGRRLINNVNAGNAPKLPAHSEFLQNLDVTGTINQLLPGATPTNEAERMVRAGSEMAGGMVTTGGAGGLKGAELASKAGAAALARTGLVGAAAKGAGDAVGLVNPTAGVVTEVLANVIGNRRATPKLSAAPQLTSADRFKEAQALYEKSKQTGVVITGKATNQMVADLRATIGDPDLAANKPAHKALDYLQKHSGDGNTGWIGIDLDKLMKVRSDMRNEAVGGGITQSKESKKVGHEMMNRFDELVATMGPQQLHYDKSVVRGAGGKFVSQRGKVPETPSFNEEGIVQTVLKDGTPVTFKRSKNEYGEGVITAYTKDKEIGALDFAYERDYAGRIMEVQPEVAAEMRRKGVASLMYDLAEKDGGLIPALNSAGATRTDLGHAFRNGREANKQAAIKAQPLTPHPAGVQEMAAFKEGMVLKQAADLAYRQASKAKIVEDMLLKAETLQGGTLAERYRAKMGQLIRSEPKFKLFSPAEQDAIRAYHKGTKTQAVTEVLAKLSPARGGILPTAGVGLAVGTGGSSLPLQVIGGLAHYRSGPQAKEAQYGMMQQILGGQQAPKQPLSAYMPSDEALRAGMFSGTKK